MSISNNLLEDVTRAYLAAKIQGVHLSNYHLHGLSYNHHRDIEKKLGLTPASAPAPNEEESMDPTHVNQRMGISPFPASMYVSSRETQSTQSSSAPASKPAPPPVPPPPSPAASAPFTSSPVATGAATPSASSPAAGPAGDGATSAPKPPAADTARKKPGMLPLVAASVGSLALGAVGGAAGYALTRDPAEPAPVVAPADPPLTEYEQRTGTVELEVR